MTTVLLVDDSPLDQRLFSELLGQESDFEVSCCGDGVAALQAIEDDPPDVVLTDMQMPIMDGLELVQRMRERFPQIPVILMTGHGSEDIATQALRAGAAGYIPKSNSADLMCETIRHVIELGKTSGIDERISAITALIQYELELENDETLIPGLLQLARQRMNECTDCDAVTLLQVGVALEQAVLNAIYHGNLELGQQTGVDFDPASRRREAIIRSRQLPYSDRRVRVVMRVTPEEVRFVVKDEGNGFDVKEVSSLGLSHSLRGDFGQGLFLMWAFMDKVAFEKTGNAVTLVKRFVAEEPVAFAVTPNPAADEIGSEAKLVLRRVEDGQQCSLTKTRATIGRDPSCDLVINSSAVSFHHCLLFLHEGWWFVRDLKSKNGIKVNGAKHDSHLLAPKATLSVGPHEFEALYVPHELGGIGITPPVNPF